VLFVFGLLGKDEACFIRLLLLSRSGIFVVPFFCLLSFVLVLLAKSALMHNEWRFWVLLWFFYFMSAWVVFLVSGVFGFWFTAATLSCSRTQYPLLTVPFVHSPLCSFLEREKDWTCASQVNVSLAPTSCLLVCLSPIS
jgi:hypothetical protein